MKIQALENKTNPLPDDEGGVIRINNFKLSDNQKPRIWIVDNFYDNPNKVRNFALEQRYFDDDGYKGIRTRKQYLFEGIKEKFETIIGKKITTWDIPDNNMNGRFQSIWAGLPQVVHCDGQKWAGMIYLTPNAPFSSGTKIVANKKSKVFHGEQTNNIMDMFPNQETFLDETLFEDVDVIGNVYNRLAIFDGRSIHVAGDYFGWDVPSGRLWQMFFFDTE
tara:strand:+ start:681 stop:1340 length:660 start_codon:yes stop_codon:yes gene_type:complete